MKGTILHGPRDVRFEAVAVPGIEKPTDADGPSILRRRHRGGQRGDAGEAGPVRHRFLPELIDLVWTGKIHPGKVFDLELPIEQVAEAYKAMDERRAIKALLRV